jgi:hypothetical protein
VFRVRRARTTADSRLLSRSPRAASFRLQGPFQKGLSVGTAMRPPWLNRADAHFAGRNMCALYQQAPALLLSGDVPRSLGVKRLDPAPVCSFGFHAPRAPVQAVKGDG